MIINLKNSISIQIYSSLGKFFQQIIIYSLTVAWETIWEYGVRRSKFRIRRTIEFLQRQHCHCLLMCPCRRFSDKCNCSWPLSDPIGRTQINQHARRTALTDCRLITSFKGESAFFPHPIPVHPYCPDGSKSINTPATRVHSAMD